LNIRSTLTGSGATTGNSVTDVLSWRAFAFVLVLLSFTVAAMTGAVACNEAGFSTAFIAVAAFMTVVVTRAAAATLVGVRWLVGKTGAALPEPGPAIGFATGAKSAAGRFPKTAFQSFARAIA